MDESQTSSSGNNGAIGRIVISRREIAVRVDELADRIAGLYAGEELTILAVLTGSIIFVADLIRRLPSPMRLDVTSVSSYPDDATASHGPRFTMSPGLDMAGRNLLIVDDILDSGRTLQAMAQAVEAMGAASVRTCVLLSKAKPGADGRFRADFVGFEIEDEFVVGYGLDFNHLYRNLPDICVLRRPARRPGGPPA